MSVNGGADAYKSMMSSKGSRGGGGSLHGGGHDKGGSVNNSTTRKGTPAQPHPKGGRVA